MVIKIIDFLLKYKNPKLKNFAKSKQRNITKNESISE